MLFKAIQHAYRVARNSIREATKARSPKWRAVEKSFLADNSCCAACGGTKRLNVHHCKPFHLEPALELDVTNLITLCMGDFECHIRIGHGDDFKAYNPNVRADAFTVHSHPDLRADVEKEAKGRRLYEILK